MNYLEKLQKALPENIKLRNEFGYEITKDEASAIAGWMLYFMNHCAASRNSENGIERFVYSFPPISERLRLDTAFSVSHKEILIIPNPKSSFRTNIKDIGWYKTYFKQHEILLK
jgi:hypothetical protein